MIVLVSLPSDAHRSPMLLNPSFVRSKFNNTSLWVLLPSNGLFLCLVNAPMCTLWCWMPTYLKQDLITVSVGYVHLCS